MIDFTDDLNTGIAVIDDQHRELFRRINLLLADIEGGRGPEAVSGTLGFLEEYIVEHFTAEENLQIHYSYPGYALHKAMHDGFRLDVGLLRERLATAGPTPELVFMTRGLVVEWLVEHIKKADRSIGAYIKTRGGA